MSKPDNRKDNVAHLQKAVQDTIENFREAENYLKSTVMKSQLPRKNRFWRKITDV